MINPIEKLKQHGPIQMLLLVEALILLVVFRAALGFVSVKRIIRMTTSRRCESICDTSIAESTVEEVNRIIWAIRTIVRHSPVEFVCFPQSLTAYCMLRQRKIASSIVYGVGRRDGVLVAHTWLTVQRSVVLGGEVIAEFSPLVEWPQREAK